MTEWILNKKPNWCPHKDCIQYKCFQNTMCSGKLPEPERHNDDFNTHRFCLTGVLPDKKIFDLQFNKTDAYYFKNLLEVVNKR